MEGKVSSGNYSKFLSYFIGNSSKASWHFIEDEDVDNSFKNARNSLLMIWRNGSYFVGVKERIIE